VVAVDAATTTEVDVVACKARITSEAVKTKFGSK
jgi:hypothetical protein